MPLAIGTAAPDFTAPTHRGETISLAQFRGQKAVVLYFYPTDGTPVCTAEACSFRDRHDELLAAGAAVIGVSGDTLESHRRFAQRQSLPFYLISDSDGRLRRDYQVTGSLLGLIPGRVTFTIDRAGIIQHVTTALLSAHRHVDEALEAVQQIP
jgi:peroxiredoxin Q/BCP